MCDSTKNNFNTNGVHEMALLTDNKSIEARLDKELKADYDDSDTRCGVGSFKPDFLQVFARIGAFIGIYCSSGLLTSTLVVYVNSQVSMLEKQFGFSSSETGLLMACNDIGFLSLVIFAGYIAKKVHIPRGLSISTMLFGICGLLCALPYFLQDRSAYDIHIDTPQDTAGSPFNSSLTAPPLVRSRGPPVPLCSLGNDTKIAGSCDAKDDATAAYDREQLWIKKVAFTLIAIGMVFQGIGKSPRYPFVTLYIDNAVEKRKTGFYMGILTGTGIFGPALAYVLGGLFSKIYVTLEDVPISPKDPRWIGAWWLGFLIFGACALITSIPIFCFPARIKKRKVKREPIVEAPVKEPFKTTKHENIVKTETKEFLFSVVRVLKNPIYLLLVGASCFNLFSVAGTNAFMPKYLAAQYTVPLWHANIILAVSNIMAIALGSFLGGIVTRHVSMTPVTTFRMLLAFYTISTTLFGVSFLLGCNQPELIGGTGGIIGGESNRTSLIDSQASPLYTTIDGTCNEGCGCDDDRYFPICGEDGNSYFSPCHAGCQQATGISFSNCTCIEGGGRASGGLCDQGCLGRMYAFAGITFVSCIIAALKIVPSLIATIRCVEPQDRSVSTALYGFLSSALAWMPAPVVFGNLIDGTCLLWRYTCGERQSCYLYDTVSFRQAIVTFGLPLKSTSILLVIIALWKVRHLKDWPHQEGAVGRIKPKKKAPSNGVTISTITEP